MATSREPENLDMCQMIKCERLTKMGRCKVKECDANPKRRSHYRAMQASKARED